MLMYTIIAYASIIIGAISGAINKKLAPNNKIIRFILKLIISVAIPLALVFGFLATDDTNSVFIQIVLTLFETAFVGILFFYGTSPVDLYHECYELAEHEFVYSDSLHKYWKPWVGHVIIAFTIGIFLFWLVCGVIELPIIYGCTIFAALVTAISIIIFIILGAVVRLLYSFISDWIKWMIE